MRFLRFFYQNRALILVLGHGNAKRLPFAASNQRLPLSNFNSWVASMSRYDFLNENNNSYLDRRSLLKSVGMSMLSSSLLSTASSGIPPHAEGPKGSEASTHSFHKGM